MGCACGKEPVIYQFGFVNFYIESLFLPLMLIGIIFAVFIYCVYTLHLLPQEQAVVQPV